MSTLKIDTSTGDLAIENNSLVILTDYKDETAQRLTSKFRFVLGEWFSEPRAGIDWYGKILIKGPDLEEVRQIFAETIESDTAVASLDRLEIDFTTATRTLAMSFAATLTDGSILEFTDFILEVNRNG